MSGWSWLETFQGSVALQSVWKHWTQIERKTLKVPKVASAFVILAGYGIFSKRRIYYVENVGSEKAAEGTGGRYAKS